MFVCINYFPEDNLEFDIFKTKFIFIHTILLKISNLMYLKIRTQLRLTLTLINYYFIIL